MVREGLQDRVTGHAPAGDTRWAPPVPRYRASGASTPFDCTVQPRVVPFFTPWRSACLAVIALALLGEGILFHGMGGQDGLQPTPPILPVHLVGTGLLVGMWIVDSLRRRRTVYEITGEWVRIHDTRRKGGEECIPWHTVDSVTFLGRPDGSGSVLLGLRHQRVDPRWTPRRFRWVVPEFTATLEDLANGRALFERIADHVAAGPEREAARQERVLWRARPRAPTAVWLQDLVPWFLFVGWMVLIPTTADRDPRLPAVWPWAVTLCAGIGFVQWCAQQWDLARTTYTLTSSRLRLERTGWRLRIETVPLRAIETAELRRTRGLRATLVLTLRSRRARWRYRLDGMPDLLWPLAFPWTRGGVLRLEAVPDAARVQAWIEAAARDPR